MKKLKNIKKSRDGMTLIEIIVAIAVLALVSIVMFAIYSVGFRFVIKAGMNSEKQYQTISTLENDLADNLDPDTLPEAITSSPENDITVNIIFNGNTISAEGDMKKIEYADDEYEMTISTFVPNPD